jgi:hypothetical protein
MRFDLPCDAHQLRLGQHTRCAWCGRFGGKIHPIAPKIWRNFTQLRQKIIFNIKYSKSRQILSLIAPTIAT